VSASCYPPWHDTVQKKLFLAPAHPRHPGKKAVKWLWRGGGAPFAFNDIIHILKKSTLLLITLISYLPVIKFIKIKVTYSVQQLHFIKKHKQYITINKFT